MQELVDRLRVAYLVLDDGDRRTIAEADLTPTQYNLLRTADEHPEDPSVSTIAKELLCTRGNVTRLVSRMAAQGLVETVGDRDDQRLVRVRITGHGRERLNQARTLLSAADERRFGSLAPSELTHYREVLDRMIQLMRADLDARF